MTYLYLCALGVSLAAFPKNSEKVKNQAWRYMILTISESTFFQKGVGTSFRIFSNSSGV